MSAETNPRDSADAIAHEAWFDAHAKDAGRQGWCIFELHPPCPTYGRWQIEHFGEPEEWVGTFGFAPPELGSDDAAIDAFRAATGRGEAHAVAAYRFLREHAPEECAAIGLDGWNLHPNHDRL